MIGIYKIKSPSGNVYIGQSRNIMRRFVVYSRISQSKSQPGVHRSFLKHGIRLHDFSVIHELPIDIEQHILDEYEKFYIDQHRDCGFTLLNLKEGGQNGAKHSKESIEKIIATKKRNIFKHSEETKAKIRAKRALQVFAKWRKNRKPAWNKGTKGIIIGNKNYRASVETREKLRLAGLGKKLSTESIAKRTATLKSNGVKRKWSDEAKRKRSESMKSKPCFKKAQERNLLIS